MKVKVTTIIDGQSIVFIGTLNKEKTIVKGKKGMILPLRGNDVIEFIAPKKRERNISTLQPCILDMHKWFKASKQIK